MMNEERDVGVVDDSATSHGYVRNPSLAVLQRRLLSPSYTGPGKWVVFDAKSRRSHLAVRHEQDLETKSIPRVLQCLLHWPESSSALTAGQVRQLAEAGLLTPAGEGGLNVPFNFLTLFQRAVFDYPFVDYSGPDASEFDAALMAEYASVSPMPSPWTQRPGVAINLPTVTWEDLPPHEQSAPFRLRELAAVLRFSFGPIGTFTTPGGERVRKANPSGGAKHPTEGWLEFRTTWQGVAAGCYVYDSQHHLLVAVPQQHTTAGSAPLTLSVRTRVERAMWRYRDPRSSRAVLLDAGHVVENVLILLRLFGVGASLDQAFPGAFGDVRQLREPEIARLDVRLADASVSHPDRSARPIAASTQITPLGPPLATNPLAYFTIGDGRFRAHSLYPSGVTTEIDELDFAILTHCIQSHRGAPKRPRDRKTGPADIQSAITGADQARLAMLTAGELLLPTDHAAPLYREVRCWSETGWYLPLLVWQEAAMACERAVTPGPESDNRKSLVGLSAVTAGLRRRQTTRFFSREPITSDQLIDLIRTAHQAASCRAEVSCFVAPLAVEGADNGELQRWDQTAGRLESLGRAITADDVVEMTIGQQWVRGSAAMFWLVARVDLDRPEHYLTPHVLLGRMTQRVCVHAAANDLGVFQTPATRDAILCANLGLPPDPALVTYSLAIGWPSSSSAFLKESRGPAG